MELGLILVGFGNVGREFARLMERKRDEIKARYDLTLCTTGIATGQHGIASNPAGLDIRAALNVVQSDGRLDSLHIGAPLPSSLNLIKAGIANVMVELSPLNPQTGQPAIDHCRAALETNLHVVTANKGPLAHAYRELRDLAAQHRRMFLFESTVMDGAPIFSTFREGLPATTITSFRAILNSTTNFILTQMEKGIGLDEAVRQAQAMGIAEADPGNDVDGWDSATKTAVLVNVLMEGDMRPTDIERTGIRDVSPETLQEVAGRGQRVKLVCSARREDGKIVGRVAPEPVSLDDPLALTTGTTSILRLDMDTLKQLTIIEHDPMPAQTAYGVLADVLAIARHGVTRE
jgi:homoserine dehydrogenase